MVGSCLHVGSLSALYSDVVASRSPLPLKETPTAPISHSVGDSRIIVLAEEPGQPVARVVPTISRKNAEHITAPTTSEIHITPEDPGDDSWTTVRC